VNWLAIFAGGGVGAVLRYAISVLLDQRFPSAFPWGTFTVNAVGCLLIGVLATLADERAFLSPGMRIALITGLLGGFTTFSTFGLETWRLIEEGRVLVTVAYSLGSLGAGVIAVALGVFLARNAT